MYANLLATSMLIDKKEDAHPSFVEIIKQLSPDEAKLLKRISEGDDSYPIIDVKLYEKDGSYMVKVQNFTLLAEGVCVHPERIYAYLDNLARLKLIEIPFGVKISDDEAYRAIEAHSEIQNLIKSSLPEGYRWEIDRKTFEITHYGKNFIETCVKGID